MPTNTDTGPRFELSVENAPAWLRSQGLNPENVPLRARVLEGGVSATVIAVTGQGVAVVVKQALARLRVPGVWEARVDRTNSEVAAMRLFAELTPASVPRVLAHDPAAHVFAMELLPVDARNWQAEIGSGRVNVAAADWAGATLGTWHVATSDDPGTLARFDERELFDQLRLTPFHRAVMEKRPELAEAISPYAEELRSVRRCIVDGDYAPKNMLLAPGGSAWKLDLEVAHSGHPVFDLGFFLSFVLLSAVRWPELRRDLETLSDRFLSSYTANAGDGFAGDMRSIVGHTACLVLARADGTSPAQFLDGESRRRARDVGRALLQQPQDGLWAWC